MMKVIVSYNDNDGIYTWHLPTTSPSVCRRQSILPSAGSSLRLRPTSADILSRRKQRIGGNVAGDGKTTIRDGASIGHPEILAPTCCGRRSLYNSQTTRASQQLRHYSRWIPSVAFSLATTPTAWWHCLLYLMVFSLPSFIFPFKFC
jgi:hypothetical protein